MDTKLEQENARTETCTHARETEKNSTSMHACPGDLR